MEICNYMKRRMKVEYNYSSEVMVTIGGSEAIDIALRAMLDPGDEVLIPQPSYVSYVPCTILAGGVPVVIELEAKDQFRLTREKLLEKITPKTKILILPFPNNPTGAIMEKEDLEAVAQVVRGEGSLCHQRRDLRGADLREKACDHCLPSWHEGENRSDQRFFQGLRHDRVENRLRLRA